MTRLTDEILSAYIDGELAPDEAARVKAALAADPVAARRLEELSGADALIRKAFRGVVQDPAALRARLETSAPIAAPRPRRWAPERIALLAASLVAGVGLGYAVGHRTQGDLRLRAGAVLADGDLAQALETQTSGRPGPVRIDFSLRTADGGVCRQFVMGESLKGLGCREDGRWRLAAMVRQDQPAALGYVPASGEGALDAAIEGLGVDAILSADQEQAAIRSDWNLSDAAPAAAASQPPDPQRSPDSPR